MSRHVISPSVLTAPEIWKMSQKNDQVWGIPGYQVPNKHFDHIKSIQNKENLAILAGEKKKQKSEINLTCQRPNIISEIEKKFKNTPEPWKYNLNQKWIHGFKSQENKQFVSKSLQNLKFKWTGVPKEKQIIEEPSKRTTSNPNMKAKKNTFIDQIIQNNTRKDYPLPGAANYFLDEKTAKIFYPQNSDLVVKKTANDKPEKDKLPFVKKKRKTSILSF